MAIVRMKRLRLIGLTEEQEPLLNELLRIGCVQVTTPEADPEDPDWAALLSKRGNSQLGKFRAEVGELNAALAALKEYAPAKGGLFTTRPLVSEEEFFCDETVRQALESARTVNRAMEAIGKATAAENRLENQKASLLPWQELDMPLNQESTEHTELVLGTLPASADLEAVGAELAEQAPLCQLAEVSRDREHIYILLLCHKSDFPAAQAALRPKAFSAVRFKDAEGTAKECLRETEAQLAEEAARKQTAIDAIVGQQEHREQMKLVIDRLNAEAGREEGRERTLATDRTFLLEGWYTAPNEDKLFKVLERYSCAWETAEPEREEYGRVPVKLENNKLTEPLNMVTEMYSLPKYGSLDPNPLMAPFFILFYGMMMADMGYGVLMIAFGVVLNKMRVKGTMKHMAGLFGLCGITTFIFGALTGSFFGDFLPQLAAMIDPDTTFTSLPHLFTPMEDTMSILVGALALGMTQTITGMAISVYKKCRDGDPLSGILDEVAWWVILLSIVGFVLAGSQIGTVLLVVGLVMMLVGQLRAANWNIIGGLAGAFGSIYNNVTGIFSDVLSYSRLMALMLAGSIVATVFNTLGTVPGNIFIFILISFVGNMLNFALNILSCYVHDLRLQCLEFFGRFYEDGGRPFQPLAVNTRYVDIIKEEN